MQYAGVFERLMVGGLANRGNVVDHIKEVALRTYVEPSYSQFTLPDTTQLDRSRVAWCQAV